MTNVIIKAADGTGSCQLHHNTDKKLETTATGVTVTGTAAATTFEGNLTGNVTGNVSGSSGSVSGNAATATALQTARTIGGVSFDGTSNITLPGVNAAGNQNTTGNAATATALETSRNIGGVAFDGTSSINLPGVNTGGTQDTSGNSATATALETSRNIGGVAFDGTSSINLPGVNTAGNQNTSGNAGTATALETPRSIGGVSFDGTSSINLPGVNTAGNQNTSANAGTATALQTPRTINGVSFDGTGNITVADSTKMPLAGGTFTGDITFDNATHAGDDLAWDMSDKALEFNDSVKATFGDSSDLEIYHNSHSYIDNNTSHLYIRNNVDDDDGGNIYIQAKSGENSIVINDDEGVNLYYDSAHKAGTTATGFQVVGVCAATSYSGDGSGLSGVTGTVFDDNNIINDLSNLALKISNLENSTKYNTNSTYVDTYQDSAGVASFTNCARDSSGEYIASVVDANVTFDWSGSGAHDQPALIGINPHNIVSSSGATGGWSNDRCKVSNNVEDNYLACYPNFYFDLEHDFTHYSRCEVNSSNASAAGGGYQTIGILVDRGTEATAGKDPQWNGSSIFRNASISGWNTYLRNLAHTNLDDTVYTSAYATQRTSDSFANHASNTGNSSTTTINMSSDSGNGTFAKLYWNSGDHTNSRGIKVTYDKSANTLTGIWVGNSNSACTGSPTLSITNVPTSGRVLVLQGAVHTGGGVSANYCTISNTGYAESNGTVSSTTTNATGNYISNAITAASTITKMGAVITYTDASGTNTLNTDIKLYLSSDGGSNWTQATLAALPDFSTGIKQAKANDVTIATAQGTSLKYKIEFANQSAGSKVARINGVSLQF
jgi:hypothetical protein